MEECGPRLKAFARTIVRSPEIAEEIVQEVFATAWSKRSQLRDSTRLESWLFKSARRAALRGVSKLSHKMESAADPETLEFLPGASVEASVRDRLLAEQSARLLEEALATLPAQRRDLLALRYFSEMSLAEIGETLDMPLGSVGTTLSRALTSLREYFQKRGLKPEDLLP